MSFLDFLDKIPDKIIPGLEAKNYLSLSEPPLNYVLWREFCHSFVSFILIIMTYLVGHNTAEIIFGILLLWITYQEFYLHPKKYGQKLWNGILDWLSWVIPFLIFFIVR